MFRARPFYLSVFEILSLEFSCSLLCILRCYVKSSEIFRIGMILLVVSGGNAFG